MRDTWASLLSQCGGSKAATMNRENRCIMVEKFRGPVQDGGLPYRDHRIAIIDENIPAKFHVYVIITYTTARMCMRVQIVLRRAIWRIFVRQANKKLQQRINRNNMSTEGRMGPELSEVWYGQRARHGGERVRQSVGSISIGHIHGEGIKEEFRSSRHFLLKTKNKIDAVVGRSVDVVYRAEATETSHVSPCA